MLDVAKKLGGLRVGADGDVLFVLQLAEKRLSVKVAC